jgi:hypothetical protein
MSVARLGVFPAGRILLEAYRLSANANLSSDWEKF